MKISTLASVTLLTLCSASTFAQDAAAGATTRDQYDTKAAASTTLPAHEQEVGAHASFTTADTDKDGKLSIAELQVVMPDLTINDTDADGYVSQAEAQASISGLAFENLEADGDIGVDEYDAIVALQDDADAADDAEGDTEN